MEENLNLHELKNDVEDTFESENINIDPKIVSDDLIERGKKEGKLSAQEVAVALEELDFDIDQVTMLYEKFEQYNIELVEDLDEDLEIDLNIDINVNSAAQIGDNIDAINIDDPVKLYLKEIGKVPLLTGD
ncbi:MAG: hypothetical protein K2I60_03865, partial [Oscillospiraceae bacterium]|nr:hypothetical protein [Oscillospiraceae bacterium]